MVQVLDRPEVQEQQQGDTLVREAPTREDTSVSTPIRQPPADEIVTAPPARRPIRWMRWLAFFGLIAAALGVALLAVRDGGSETASVVPRTADGAEGWIVSTQPVSVVPQTADGAEGWIVSTQPVVSVEPLVARVPRTADGYEQWRLTLDLRVPRTADGAEGWILSTIVPAVPQTADGAEGWLLSTQAVVTKVPRTADGAEGWILSTDPVPRTADGAEGWIVSTIEPVIVLPTGLTYLPVSQIVPPVAGDVELTFLPVSQPTPAVSSDDGAVALSIQPLLRVVSNA